MKNINNLFVNIYDFPMKVGISLRRLIHPQILRLMPERRTFDFELLNDKPKKDKPGLYIVTHSTCHDAPIACEAIKDHFYVLVGKQPLELMDRIFFSLNGVIWVDRDNPKSEVKAFKKMTRLLKYVDVVSFSEQTWCKKPSTPINPIRRGWAKVAKESESPVIPLALEYYEHTGDNICYGKYYDKLINVDENDNIIEKNEELEDIFANLKFDIWNLFPVQKRAEIDSNLWDKIMTARQKEYPKLDINNEQKYVIGWKNDPDYVLENEHFLAGIEKVDAKISNKQKTKLMK